MKLSIVATLYKSAPYITEFYQRASAAAKQQVGEDYEIVLVNDGSPDNSLDLAVQLTESDSHVVVVDLSRNFGHHKAIMTGLAYAKGEQVFLIDSDLEEEPECLISFASQMKRDTCDVVYGMQDKRKGGWFERWSGQLFYRVFNTLTGLALPENLITARLMTRRYVDALLLHKERELMLAGIWHITGFDQRAQKVTKCSTSETTYTFRHKMSVLVNGVTSFSNAPLLSIFYLGTLILTVASVYIVYLILSWIFIAKPLSGWTSVMASIWFLGGMIIAFIGVVGIYLAKIFSETKQRPYTIVRQIYSKQKKMENDDLKENSIANTINLESHYTDFWTKRLGVHFYPPEFLVRTFLSKNCPNLIIEHDYENKNVLDLGCGDGRSMGLLSNLGMNISGSEITKEICEAVTLRMAKFGIKADIRVGRNNLLPFDAHSFDYIVASASVYYVDSGTTFEDNMLEIQRVLKPGGHIIFSLVHPDTYILNGADELLDSHFRIKNDPLGLRNGYIFKVFKNQAHVAEYFSKNFIDISIGYTSDDYYGLKQDLWLLVAKKIGLPT